MSAKNFPQQLSFPVLAWEPQSGAPQQLMLLLHGVGANAADMAPLAFEIHREFPQALVVALEGLAAFDGDPSGQARQWFSLAGVTEENRPERIAQVLPELSRRVLEIQQAAGLSGAATALWGFSQGAILALALAHAHDGIAGRVMAFAGRYARLPESAPRLSTLHWFHGAADPVIPARLAEEGLNRLADLGADATLDVAEGVGHQISGALLARAFFRLRNHIPARTWAEAMSFVPAAGSDQAS